LISLKLPNLYRNRKLVTHDKYINEFNKVISGRTLADITSINEFIEKKN